MGARTAVAILVLAALILPSLGTVRGGPEPPTGFATAYNTQRKLARVGDTLYAAVTLNVSGTPQVRVLASTEGSSWSSLPNPSVTGNATDRVALAVDSRGRLQLVWTELTVQGGQVFHAAYADGAWTVPVQLSSSPGYAGFPSIAVDARDRVHIVWYGFDGTFYQIYYRRFDGVTWTPEAALTSEAVDATNPSIGLGPEGHVHVAWFRQNRNATLNEVAYLRLEGSATPAELRTVSTPGVDSIDPTLAVGADGTVRLAWSALVGSLERIQYRERAVNGSWGPTELVSPAAVGGRHPSLALPSPGAIRLAWEGSDGQIYLQSREGGAWASPIGLTAAGANRYPSARWAQFHEDACSGQFELVWTHEEGAVRSLAYAVPEPGVCPRPSPTSLLGFVGAAVLIVAIVGVLAWPRTKERARRPSGPR